MSDPNDFFKNEIDISDKPSYEKPAYNGGNNNSYNKGGYKGGGSFNKFQKKPFDPNTFSIYKPVVITANDNVPDNVVNEAEELCRWLLSHGFTIRLSCTSNLENKLMEALPRENLEIYLPFKGFNNIESKLYWNDEISKFIAAKYNRKYDQLPDVVKAFLARNVRMVMGEKAKSYALATIVWTADGVESVSDITRETGNMSHVISVANGVHMKVYNLSSEDYKVRLFHHLKPEEPKSFGNNNID